MLIVDLLGAVEVTPRHESKVVIPPGQVLVLQVFDRAYALARGARLRRSTWIDEGRRANDGRNGLSRLSLKESLIEEGEQEEEAEGGSHGPSPA